MKSFTKNSLMVAELFEKKHKNVIRSIEVLISNPSKYSEEFKNNNFKESQYTDSCSRRKKCYLLTTNGFDMLTKGYTTNRIRPIKERVHYSNTIKTADGFIQMSMAL